MYYYYLKCVINKSVLLLYVGSFYGAWDYIGANAQKGLISPLFMGYKKGKHLQQLFGKSMKDYQLSPEAMKHALSFEVPEFSIARETPSFRRSLGKAQS